MPQNYEQSLEIAEPLTGKTIKRYKQLALDNRVWLALGGFPEAVQGNEKKRYSKPGITLLSVVIDTCIIVNEEGSIVHTYRKMHLYDVDLTHKVSY